MARWLACTVLAAFILGDAAGAQEGRDRYWVDAAVLGWKIGNAPQPTPLVTAGSLAAPLPGALGQPGTSGVGCGASPIFHPNSAASTQYRSPPVASSAPAASPRMKTASTVQASHLAIRRRSPLVASRPQP